MSKKNGQNNEEIIIEGAENMSPEELKKAITKEKARRTREANKKNKAVKETAKSEVKQVEQINNNIDLDAILSVKKYKKKALSFNQDKSVADVLTARAEAAEKKPSEALSLILGSIIDLDNMTCKIDIDEKKEEKVPNTFKVDERIIEVLKKEAESRNMSVNEYLNKVLKVVLNI
ncbi:hypothetical protein ACV3T0_13810 [Clostridium perfringens]